MEKEIFEAGVKSAVPLFKRAKGCKSASLQRCATRTRSATGCSCNGRRWRTTPSTSAAQPFQEWRKLVGHCFTSPPNVEHVTEVMRGF